MGRNVDGDCDDDDDGDIGQYEQEEEDELTIADDEDNFINNIGDKLLDSLIL